MLADVDGLWGRDGSLGNLFCADTPPINTVTAVRSTSFQKERREIFNGAEASISNLLAVSTGVHAMPLA